MYFVEKTREFNFLKRFDYMFFVPVFLLSIVGLLLVRSATLTRPDGGIRIMIMQTVSLILGIMIAFILSTMDYNDLKHFGILFYIVTNILLILVLLIGTGEDLGSRRWIVIGGFSLQPSEFSKISFVIVAAIFLNRIKEDDGDKKVNIMKFIIYTFIPIFLIILQKDFGTSLVFIFILFVMLYVYGVKYRYIVSLALAGLATTPLIWNFALNEARRNRIRVFLDPELDPLGAGFNVLRSKMAIGSGQLYGKGLFQGVQSQSSTVPVKESDFIFSVLGEELGFIGSVIVVLLVLFILLKCIHIAMNAREHYGGFLVTGVVGMLGMQFVENIGMTMGMLPVTGLPMPFVSAGGTSLLANYMAIGLVLSVSMRRQKSLFNIDGD